jgi:hypothetical protein
MLWKREAQSDLCLLDLPLRGSWAKQVPGMGSMDTQPGLDLPPKGINSVQPVAIVHQREPFS